jgi:hypothetical protein
VSSVERLLADGYWKDGVWDTFPELDLKLLVLIFTVVDLNPV